MARTITPLTGERANLETPALILELDVRDRNIVAKLANNRPFLRYRVVQAYWGNLQQQVMPFAERARQVRIQIERIRAVVAALRAEGVGPDIVTGGGTGTHAIDGTSGLFTDPPSTSCTTKKSSTCGRSGPAVEEIRCMEAAFPAHPEVPISKAVRAGDFLFTSAYGPWLFDPSKIIFDDAGNILEDGTSNRVMPIAEQIDRTTIGFISEALNVAGCSLGDVVSRECWLADPRFGCRLQAAGGLGGGP